MKFSLSDKPGFKQFLIRLGVLFGVVILLPLLMYPLLELTRFPRPFPHFNLTDVGMAVMFFIIALTLISKQKLFALKKYSYSIKEGVFFLVWFVFSTALYLYSRYVISSHFDYYGIGHYQNSLFFNLVPVCLMCIFLFLAVFNIRFVRNFLVSFRKELMISSLMIVLYYLFTLFVRKSWLFLGGIVSRSVAFLLGLSFDNVVLVDKGYNFMLGAEGFVASIGDLCSGIDSIALFTGLFILILAYDWKILDKKRMAIIFIPGLVGTVIVNIFRIYLLYLAGIFISTSFAVGMFHSNIGMILFIAYFVLFWWAFYRWVKR